MEGMKHRLESICSSVEQRAANVDGRINQVDNRINEMERRMTAMEARNRESGQGGYKWKPIMENKSMENMKTVAESGKDYRIWNQKLKNNMEQIRPGAR